jgi:WD40 repeat protein
MAIQHIENITKLIFMNYNKYDLDHLFDTINNQSINITLLKLIDYKNLLSSLGKGSTILGHHDIKVQCILELSDGNIISASWDKTFKLWNPKNGNCMKTLKGHNLIRALISLPNGNIASSSSCKKSAEIKIWNPNQDFECIQTTLLEGYTDIKKLIALSNNNIASSVFLDDSPYLIIFDYNNGYTLSNSLLIYEVSSLAHLYDNKFASTNRDYDIILWDIDKTPAQFKVLKKAHTDDIWCLAFSNKYGLLYSGAADAIRIWDCKSNYECINAFKAHDGLVTRLILLPNGYFASGSNDAKIKIWDRNCECINTLSGGKGYVTSILFLKDYRIAITNQQENMTTIFNYN